MANYYVDHGAYGVNAVFVGSIATTVLTVTSVTSGTLAVGQQLTLPSADTLEATFISSQGTGSGGTGTYNLSRSLTQASTTMHARFSLPPDTPVTWGSPQEGDGTASTPATSSATVSINLSAATAAAGATMSIMGAVLTCVASGAGNNQFNAGAGATLVANLVAAINRTTNTSTLVAQASGWATPKIQDAVFARVGSPTTTLEIMTRAGSAQYNSSTVATSGLTGGSFGPYTFSGGSGGCWGYLMNQRPIWPSAVAAPNYGVWSTARPLAGTWVAGDIINIRAAKTIWVAGGSPTIPGAASSDPVVRHIVDDSVIWSDGTNPVVRLAVALTGGVGSGVTTGAGVVLVGKKHSGLARSLVFERMTGSSGNDVFSLLLGTSSLAINIAVRQSNTVAAVGVSASPSTNAANGGRMIGCVIYQEKELGTTTSFSTGTNGTTFLRLEDSDLVLGTPTGPKDNYISENTNPGYIDFVGCRFVNFPVGSRLKNGTANANNLITLKNCSMGGVTKLGPNFTTSTATLPVSDFARAAGVIVSNDSGSNDFVLDFVRMFWGWNSAASYPTLNARLLDGVTPWSVRGAPSTVAGRVSKVNPVMSPRIGKYNTLATATRTITLKVLIDKSLNWNCSDISLDVEYVDSSDVVRMESTFVWASTALTTASDVWSNMQIDPADSVSKPTFNDGGTIYYNRYALSLTTAFPIKTGTEISAYLSLRSVVSNATQSVFYDPEFLVA